LHPITLARTYRVMLRDPVFCWLSLAASFNFSALFLYIASAPAFILNVLALGEQDFAWLFVPAIGGMMIGAALSGRLAGKRSPAALVQLGYRLIAAGAIANLSTSLLWPPGLPWSVLPVGFGAVGITLAFPTLTLLMLDRFPATRGTASSLQTAISLLIMALISGVLSPLVSHDAWSLAGTSALLSLTGYACWRRTAERV
jgi:DHA1 family bicyclomycin/chloramphenicol resistance-like MFS transporter